LDGPVVVVGHSMGGMAITQAAEYAPVHIGALVYVCAFLPGPGQSLLQLADNDPAAQVIPNLQVDEQAGICEVAPDARVTCFYEECDPAEAAAASARLVPESLAVFAAPADVTEERAGSVRRIYVECLRDRAISIAKQREMHHACPCDRVVAIDTDHSPFLSRPDELAAHLLSGWMARSWGELLGEANAEPEPQEQGGRLFSRLRDSLSKSRRALTGELAAAAFDPGNDLDWERLEEALIAGDVGVRATAELVQRLEARGELGDLNAALADEVAALFGEPPALDVSHGPTVVLVVGVNGTGKTTTIGKLAAKLAEHGHSVLVAAADTYRAAAEEQLEIWAQRAGADFVGSEDRKS